MRISDWSSDVCSSDLIADIAYGSEERHRLDVYPHDKASAPVLLFLHGGGFVGGDKSGDPLFYGNVGRYFATHGFLTILANYRLAPASTWPSGIDDLAAIIACIGRHGDGPGGDAGRSGLVGPAGRRRDVRGESG